MIVKTQCVSRLDRPATLERPLEDASRGWLADEFGQLCRNAAEVRRALPKFVFCYLCLIYTVMALLVWWVPVCDFDSLSSYLARIQLERIGPLRETGTLELQYIFPKFFDYLHAPLLDWGWFTTLPNFALFTIVLAVAIRVLPTAVAVRFILGLAISSPVIAGVTSAKNDVTLGLIGLLCWFWIYYSKAEKPWYLAVAMLLTSMLVGTKWHGLVLAPLFAVMAGVRVLREGTLRWSAVLLLMAAAPLAWHFASADVYLENLRIDGSICPRPDFLNHKVGLRRNLWAFPVNHLLETFEAPFYCSDAYLHTDFWSWLNRATINGKAYNYAVLPNSHLTVYGLPILVVIGASIVALFARKSPAPVRACAFLSLAYCGVLLICFNYSSWINRYFLPVYLFALVPTAYWFRNLSLSGVWKLGFYAYLLFASAHTMLLNQEKRLVPYVAYSAQEHRYNSYATIFSEKLDRDSLYCHVWAGFIPVYREFRERVQSHHQVLVVNSMSGGHVPFIYPFIRGRSGNNTRVVNTKRGQSIPSDLEKYDFVVAFPGEFAQPGFKLWLESLDLKIYKRETERRSDRLACVNDKPDGPVD